jgi:tetratricopeptide (TPR) repeat protein
MHPFYSEQTPSTELFKNTTQPQINIVWEGSFAPNTRQGRINRAHCANLLKTGVADLTIIPAETDELYGNDEISQVLKAYDIRFKKPAPEGTANLPYAWISHVWPPKSERPRGARWIAMVSEENSTEAQDFVDILKNADEVLVLSENSRDTLLQAGLDDAKVLATSYNTRMEFTHKRATLTLLTLLDEHFKTNMAAEAAPFLKDADDGINSINDAEELFKSGDVDGAIATYTEAFKNGGIPDKYILHALHRLASIALEEDDVELAGEFLLKVEEIRADHIDTIYLRAKSLALQEKWVEVQETLSGLLKNWGNIQFDTTLGLTLDIVLCDTARALLSTNAVEEAQELYAEVLKMNPESGDACYGLAQCFKKSGQHDAARNMLEWAVRLQPDLALAVEELEEISAE